MSRKSPVFRELAGLKDVYAAQSGQLRCTAIRLRGGSLCLYSPVAGLEDEGRASLQGLGEVSILLAPNHYHNKALTEYVQSFPNAHLVCSTAASPRLSKVTGLEFSGLDTLTADLPPQIQILVPEGLKTGEIWCQIEYASDIIWIVTDAFSAAPAQTGEYAEEPSMLGTFPKFGVRDRSAYRSWVEEQISHQPPTILIPCHGTLVKNSNLGEALEDLLGEHL